MAGAAWAMPAGFALAESGTLNLHLDIGGGLPLTEPLGGSKDDGVDRSLFGTFISADLQLSRPWAAEAQVGFGYQFENATAPGSYGENYWNFGLGARRRFYDDELGYLFDPAGNLEGNLWVSAHIGFALLDDVQFGLDAAVGYEFSIFRPVQLGVFTRMAFMAAGRNPDPDVAVWFGITGSVAIRGDNAPEDTDGDGIADGDDNALREHQSRDSDGDGIPDYIEQKGLTDPLSADSDKDGIPDGEEDKNRNGRFDPGETDPSVRDTDHGGIPDGEELERGLDPRDPSDDDRDGDGVPVAEDLCPDTTAGREVDPSGCPVLGDVFVLNGISFESGSSILSPASEATLGEALQVLDANPDVRVEVAGHTDNVGRGWVNRRIATERAQAVKDWLVERGVEPSRLRVRGYGAASPVADNSTEEGRAQNRRIEFRRLR